MHHKTIAELAKDLSEKKNLKRGVNHALSGPHQKTG